MRQAMLMAGLVLVAGCDKPAPQPSPTATAEPASPAAPAADTTVPATAIPEALRGRWGLVAADCTSIRGDNKGILEIGPDSLRFYESRGRLGQIASATADSIRATYAFTGEGMEWTREMQMRLIEGGTPRLERIDYGPDAAPEPLVYERCSA